MTWTLVVLAFAALGAAPAVLSIPMASENACRYAALVLKTELQRVRVETACVRND